MKNTTHHKSVNDDGSNASAINAREKGNNRSTATAHSNMRSIMIHNAARLAGKALKIQSPRVLASVSVSSRSFAKLTAPGPDPLEVLRETCLSKSLCDEGGFRVPGVHWVFSVAVNSESPDDVSADGLDVSC